MSNRLKKKKIIKLSFEVYKEGIIIEKICLKGYKLKKYIAEDGYATVHQACSIKKDRNYVVKIQKFDFHYRCVKCET